MNLYRKWDERSLRQMTPKRERILLERWRVISNLGYFRFMLPFLGCSLLVSVLLILRDRRALMRAGFDLHGMSRFQTEMHLQTAAIFILTGLLLSVISYFGFRMWAMKIASWKSGGRL
jgi:hypothetical protein